MSVNSGLNYRVPPGIGLGPLNGSGLGPLNVPVADDASGDGVTNPETGAVTIPLPDGVVEIVFGGMPQKAKSSKFDDNLAEHLGQSELHGISEELLRLIEQDDQSRTQWLENRKTGLGLLALEIKTAAATANGVSPQDSISKYDDPLLLESCIRAQANLRAELLSTDGPVKVRNDGPGTALAAHLAPILERDVNHFLTTTASEYYPDTDRMLFMTAFGGIGFKKGYHCPIRRRPVIESIDAKDLIVSNTASDLRGAGRVTHSVKMRPSTLKRMQLLGVYRDVAIRTATPTMLNPVEQTINQIQGVAPQQQSLYADDLDRDLYECYCELDIPGFEHKEKGKETGLPIPYKVVIDRDSREVLEIRRNWRKDDKMCLPKTRIVAYIYIPGLGFYSIGLLNILGNTTRLLTAARREMVDAGMFANFPGFLYLKALARQLTNEFRVMPGTGMPIDAPTDDIRKAIMPLPYKTADASFVQFIDNIAQNAQRLGGTAELQVGEGRQDAPVGTTLALIEQATKPESAVHKRMHQSQCEEFVILKELLSEDPAALWRHNKKSEVLKFMMAQMGMENLAEAEEADEQKMHQMFVAALNDINLIPAADPNTHSQTERYLKTAAMQQITANDPAFDQTAIKLRSLEVLGFDDADSLLNKAPPQELPPDPRMLMAQAAQSKAQSSLIDSQTKAKTADIDAQIKQMELTTKLEVERLQVRREEIIHAHDSDAANRKLQADMVNQHLDRHADLQKHAMSVGADQQMHQGGLVADWHNAQNKHAMDWHKYQGGLVVGSLDRNADIYKHINDQATDLHKHHTQLAADREQAERDREAQAEQARKVAQSKPNGSGGKG